MAESGTNWRQESLVWVPATPLKKLGDLDLPVVLYLIYKTVFGEEKWDDLPALTF